MNLTGELKEQVERKETKEETKELIKETMEDAGMILSDEELDQISGGVVDGIDGESMSESFREYRNS